MSKFRNVVIASAARTPVGSFRSTLSSVPATVLGGVAVKGALERAHLEPSQVQDLYFGNVVSANLGQAPSTQVARLAGIPSSVPTTLVNKVCASGMKAITLGASQIQLGHCDVVVAGGMESMSNAPYYLDQKARAGYGYGHQTVTDSIIKDGLWDAQYQIHMGSCAEETAEKFSISRQQQDEHAISSYKRAAQAHKDGVFKSEIVPVPVKIKGKVTMVEDDEEFKRVDFSKIGSLKPVFKSQGGSVTAANASTLNDGASAVVLMSEDKAKSVSGLKPLARIIAYCDTQRDPKEFTIAPADAIKKLLSISGKKLSDISLFEINEAFSVVVRANEKILGLDPEKVNIAGGGVSLGHPIGSSGSRIVITLTSLLKSGQIGCAAICNGGGGATGILIEKL
ncbi:hypothetical protein MIR68_007878 [Amoeboaphelidium protococcarum]|nr:hypothetical protein MIR68_007878 [Amoeboaphelidium protococcarum]KAI3654561.1 hypothetical protein MP228_000615 [Amoeboaphelidium protococcarum]